MKKIFLAVVALAAMTACSNDEFVSVDRAPINFGEAFVDNATRATDPTYGGTKTLDHFYVYATVTGNQGTVRIFGGDKVTGTVGSTIVDGVSTPNIWTCSTKTEYWVPGADYKFAAVVDYWSIDATNDGTLGLPKIIGYSTDIANGDVYQKDLLYATAEVTNASADQGPVNFTFEHLLSKVQFTVTSTAQGNYSHSIKNITVKNFQNGDYTIGGDTDDDGKDDGTWNSTTTPSHPISFGNIDGVTNGSKTNATQMLLIPTNEDFVVSFDVEVWNGSTKISTEHKDITVTKDLVKGNAYNFTIECKLNSPIKFSVTDNPTGWGNGGELNVQ